MIALLALAAHLAATVWLNASYAASSLPVPYHVAQLSFDAGRMEGWYATLRQLGTFDAYIRTQFVDFAFIASVTALHPAVLLLVGRAFPPAGNGRKRMAFAAALSLVAPAADAAENLVSFVMLARPDDISTLLAWTYSSFATLKFAMFVFAYAAVPIGLAAAAVGAGRRWSQRAADGRHRVAA